MRTLLRLCATTIILSSLGSAKEVGSVDVKAELEGLLETDLALASATEITDMQGHSRFCNCEALVMQAG